MGVVISNWLNESSPNYLIFPINESIDAMVAYETATQLGIKTMCYSHGRTLRTSFFSDSCNETFPFFKNQIIKNYEEEVR